MMHGLGAVGYHQSYTYFTWRTGKREIEDYLAEVSRESDHLMRPNFFVNTPDILHAYLQYGGPAAFKVRAALAATGSPSWGVYAGYELFEHVAVKPGAEEYLDSEKFQIRIRDWEKHDAEGTTLAPYLTRLNEIRRQHPAAPAAAQRHDPLHRRRPGPGLQQEGRRCPTGATTCDRGDQPRPARHPRDDDPPRHAGARPQTGTTPFVAHDEITGEDWSWHQHNYVRLDPGHEPAHIISVRSTR